MSLPLVFTGGGSLVTNPSTCIDYVRIDMSVISPYTCICGIFLVVGSFRATGQPVVGLRTIGRSVARLPAIGWR
ncbi:MAG: hypothetical protein Q4C47_00060 [Planctomycetia bacterium]|nr:hypothetical protein [Planctomycetia bacterium]